MNRFPTRIFMLQSTNGGLRPLNGAGVRCLSPIIEEVVKMATEAGVPWEVGYSGGRTPAGVARASPRVPGKAAAASASRWLILCDYFMFLL